MSWFRRDNHLTETEISAYIDGEVMAARAASVRAHIDGCDACRTVFDELGSVKTMLSALPRPVLTRSFTLSAEVAQKVPARGSSRSPFAFAPAVSLTALALLLAVDLVGLPAGRQAQDESAAGSATLAFDAAVEDTASKATANAEVAPMSAPAQSAGPPPRAGGAIESVPGADVPPLRTPASAPQPALVPPSATQAPPTGGTAVRPEDQRQAAAPPPLPAVAATSDGFADSAVGEFPADDAFPSRPPVTDVQEVDSGRSLLRALEVVAGGAFILSLVLAWLSRRRAA